MQWHHIPARLCKWMRARELTGELPCRNKHQRQQQYPLSKEGFDMITADLKLMCDNCHSYNQGDQELQE